jgi:hypothetical protein
MPNLRQIGLVSSTGDPKQNGPWPIVVTPIFEASENRQECASEIGQEFVGNN